MLLGTNTEVSPIYRYLSHLKLNLLFFQKLTVFLDEKLFVTLSKFSKLITLYRDLNWVAVKDSWARIRKRLRSPGIDSKESILPAYVACRAGTRTLHMLAESIPGLLKRLQIRALGWQIEAEPWLG